MATRGKAVVFRSVVVDLASKGHASCVFDAEIYGCFDPRHGSVHAGSRSPGYDVIVAGGNVRTSPGVGSPTGLDLQSTTNARAEMIYRRCVDGPLSRHS